MRLSIDSIKNCNYFSLITGYERQLQAKENKGDTKGVNELLNLISDIYRTLALEAKNRGKYNDAIMYTQKRRENYQKTGKNLKDVLDELEELYSIKANEFCTKGNFKKAIDYYELLKEIYDKQENSKKLLDVYGILGQLYHETSNIRNAVLYFTKLKDLAENKQDYTKKMLAFQNLGICYQLIKDYSNALNNFKLLLQLAWKENNIEMELISYDYMSIQYFYLGDLVGARYYHDRTWKGITEKFKSPVRELSNKALKALKNREKIPIRGNFERIGTIKKGNSSFAKTINVEIGLPSPRTSSGVADQRILPFASAGLLKTKERRASKCTSNKYLNKTTEIPKQDKVCKSIKPFMLLSHLSPIESVKNFFYVDQISFHK